MSDDRAMMDEGTPEGAMKYVREDGVTVIEPKPVMEQGEDGTVYVDGKPEEPQPAQLDHIIDVQSLAPIITELARVNAQIEELKARKEGLRGDITEAIHGESLEGSLVLANHTTV